MRPPDEGGPAPLERILIAASDWLRAGARRAGLTRWRTRGLRPEDFRAERDHAATAVCLPGIHEDWRSLAVWAQALHEDGWDVRLLPELGAMTAPVPELAGRVGRLLERKDLRDVALVAHSKGGLVGASVMGSAQGVRVRGMVAVATPFAGSPVARLARLTPGFRELAPGSPALDEIAAIVPGIVDRILHVEAAWDQSVPACPLPGARRHAVLPLAGHESMMADPRAARAIARLARTLPTDPPIPAADQKTPG